MPSVTSLLAAHLPGNAGSLEALAFALGVELQPATDLPTDPVELLADAEAAGFDEAGTWQEVRAARDLGILSVQEYDYLAAAIPEDPS